MIFSALAQITNPVIGELGKPTAGETSIAKIIATVIRVLVVFGAIMMLLQLFRGATSWITSSGKSENLEKARNEIIHAISGMIILVAVVAIVALLGGIFGIDLLNLNLPGVTGQ